MSLDAFYFLFGVIALILGFWGATDDLHIGEYVAIVKRYNKPAADSSFYLSEYCAPDIQSISFPQKKKNLVLILMESMESSFCDEESGGLMDKNLIPNLTRLAAEHINFSGSDRIGGGIDVSGTGWTIAAMTSKFAGVPFSLRGSGNQNRNFFLPNAVTLTDILSQNGYSQLFLFGSDKRFAGRDALLETHGDVEIHDLAWYKANGMIPGGYHVFWGFEDEKLYRFAEQELENLSGSDQPFMFGLLTVDTHAPGGYKCALCPTDEDVPIRNAIRCADSQVASFLDWCEKQPWWDDTVFVILGDHRFMATAETNPFRGGAYLDGGMSNPRRWIDIFIHALPQNVHSSEAVKNRVFSSLDMFPTILAALGCTIDGERLGLGVNLFSGEKTLLERYPKQYLNSELTVRNRQYEQLEFIASERN